MSADTHTPIAETIQQRFSCRTFHEKAISEFKQQDLRAFIDSLPPGPFESRPRFQLITATESERASLSGLGTYGFIRNPSGFIAGAMTPSPKEHEDFGYLMERIILHAASLDLGTCWLGGSFTKSSFAKKIDLKEEETIPAVTAIGEFIDPAQARQGLLRRLAKGNSRLAWDALFFDDQFGHPLDRQNAGAYALPLEMVRIAPSASNKQPWRVIKSGSGWHFYLRRTPGYRSDPLKRFLGLCDLQRLDLGIAMCHFELSSRDLGQQGRWIIANPFTSSLPDETEYIASWVSD